MQYELYLGILTIFTSAITAVAGVGGGMVLIAILPSFLPVTALIPVHGLTQLSSNFSRAFFGYKDIRYEVIPKFLLGSLLGVAVISSVLLLISLKYVPLFIGLYILLSLWSNKFNNIISRYESYFIIGFFQSGLSLVVGATGPITMALLMKEYKDTNQVIVTSAALMTITHILKVVVFIGFGFVFMDYIWVIVSMIVGAFIGSYIGTKLRQKLISKKFILFLKIFLSILALKSIVITFL